MQINKQTNKKKVCAILTREKKSIQKMIVINLYTTHNNFTGKSHKNKRDGPSSYFDYLP